MLTGSLGRGRLGFLKLFNRRPDALHQEFIKLPIPHAVRGGFGALKQAGWYVQHLPLDGFFGGLRFNRGHTLSQLCPRAQAGQIVEPMISPRMLRSIS